MRTKQNLSYDDPHARLLLEMVKDSVKLIKTISNGKKQIEFSGNKVKSNKFINNEIDFLFGDKSRISFTDVCDYLGVTPDKKRIEIREQLQISEDAIKKILHRNEKDKVFNKVSKKNETKNRKKQNDA